ncbi:hypothetical protein EDD11_009712 [Mortierella claussenii]|nr:hypothetical protein EDD11_009712 [Mortierella claussenii]
MALKQQVAHFLIRNPYRLDRPQFDAQEVWRAALAEEAAAQHSQLSLKPLSLPPMAKRQLKGGSWSNRKTNSPQSKQKPILESEVTNNFRHQDGHRHFEPTWFGQEVQHQPSVLPPIHDTDDAGHLPTITISHHIDSHSELTFERHVEWLTQTALWWDMPVVHLYPAPESSASLAYVESAASRFSSWVNFVKIPAGEESHLGPATSTTKSTQPCKVNSARVIRVGKEDSARDRSVVQDGYHEGGMVTSRARGMPSSNELATAGSALEELEPIVGYVFVGSAEEQVQYHHVFETMGKLYPMIEVRYINSFEPQNLQSRQQQELREEPCLHSLSWIHYWSAAKESQVLQSKIVNEVVQVRPMWVNNDYLHRNYVPPVLSTPPSPPADILECPTFSLSASTVLDSPTVYIGNGLSKGQSFEDSLRGIPSTVSIASLLDVDSSMDGAHHTDVYQGFNEDHAVIEKLVDDIHESLDLQQPSKRTNLSRTQSSLDICQDSKHTYWFLSRSSKKWNFETLGSGSSKEREYRRSVSAPLLVILTKDHIESSANSNTISNDMKCMDNMDSDQNSDTNTSPSPLSPPALNSPTSTASTTSSASSMSSTSLLGFGHRLAGIAHRLGTYKPGRQLL